MFIRRATIAAAAIAAPLAFAAPAMAAPVEPGAVDCSAPCVVTPTAIFGDPPIWNQIFANGPWEKAFDPAGDGNGAWEQGVTAVNGGAWEKAFPPPA
jgi:hypothetical protein